MSTTQQTQTTQPEQQQPPQIHVEDTELTTAQDAESQTPITRTVVIALDHSSHSQQAFEWSMKNFLRKETDLVFTFLFDSFVIGNFRIKS